MNESKVKANTCSGRQARENACEQHTTGFGFTSNWLKVARDIFSQSQSVTMQTKAIGILL